MQSVQVWNKEEIFFSSDAYFERLFEDLERARLSIDIEAYIYSRGIALSRLCLHLRQKGQSGIRVRVLIDGFGVERDALRELVGLRSYGVKVRVYHPIPGATFLLKYGLRGASNFLNLCANINRRNHRKVVMIDNQRAYVGSVNISDVHMKEANDRRAWRDTCVYVEGAEVEALKKAFNEAWKKGWSTQLVKKVFNRARVTPSRVVLLNYKRRLRIQSESLIEKTMRDSKNKIWITNAYFVPQPKLVRLFCECSKNGADVRILVPAKSDVQVVRLAAIAFYEKLLKHGVKIYEYEPSVLHAKTMVFDDKAIIGSSNLNYRSFLHDLEVNVVLSMNESVSKMQNKFIEDCSRAKEIKIEFIKKLIFKKIIARIILMFRYFL